MLTKDIIDQYEATIGIECHVQLNTKTKLFSAVSNDARDAEPNTTISPICFGLPGALPVLNEKAVELAVRAGLAINCEIGLFSKFDRKHYFYPDLPMGYQITQFDEPIVGKGSIPIIVCDNEIQVGITRAHLEADAGKSTHPPGRSYSLVDLNRAGTPLLEIVSEPDMHSPAEARAYCQELYYRMKYAKVSDVDLFHGNMRFDVNISVAKKGSKKLGTRAEIKNLNSFRSVEKAAEYEMRRQIELLEKGEEVVQETRGWDDAKMRTQSQRSKEDAHDYRYFPDPDLPPVVLDEAYVEDIRSSMPILPDEIRTKLTGLGLDKQSVEALLDRDGEAGLEYVKLIIEVLDGGDKQAAAFTAKFIINEYFGIIDKSSTVIYLPTVKQFCDAAALLRENRLSSTNAKRLLTEKLSGVDDDLLKIAEQEKLLQVSDIAAIEKIVDEVIESNASAAQDVRDGEMKAIGYLVGQVMKQSKGQADPKLAQELLKKKLS